MKKIIRHFSILLFAITSTAVFSQTAPAPYEVATWAGFSSTAVNYTFDDGCANQFNIAIPLFDKHDFKLTLFTVTNWVGNWSKLQTAALNGHEVAGHTVSHANFSSITAEQQDTEQKNCKSIIESNIPDRKCLTMAYPFCAAGADSIGEKYYISARGCQGFIEPKTPGSYLNVSSVIVGNQGAIKSLPDFKTTFEDAAKSNGWCVLLLHGIDNDGGYSPIPSADLTKSVEYLAARKSKFWVTTFLNATLYSKERDAAVLEEISATDTSFTLKLSDNLPDSVYNYPLSVRRPLPVDWPSADVTQDSIAVPLRIVQIDTVVYIAFEAVPDGGEISISRNSTPVTPEIDTIPVDEDEEEIINTLNSGKPEPSFQALYRNGSITISMNDFTGENLLVRLFDMRGTELMKEKYTPSGNENFTIDLSGKPLATGIYILSLSDGNNLWNKKIIVC